MIASIKAKWAPRRWADRASRPLARVRASGQVLWVGLFMGVLLGVPPCTKGAGPEAPSLASKIRIGVSAALKGDANESDAMAALKAGSDIIARQGGFQMDYDVKTLSSGQIKAGLEEVTVDVVAMTIREYASLSGQLQPEPFFAAMQTGTVTEEYIILVHQDSGIQNIRGLGQRVVLALQNSQAKLMPEWLDVLCLTNGLPPFAKHCGSVEYANQVLRAVLPVFFRKADACVVTRKGFATMKELNPQLSKVLKEIACSPKLVVSGCWFRRGYESPFKETLVSQVVNLHKSPVGQQLLTIFEVEQMATPPAASLQSALDLLAAHDELCGQTHLGRGRNPEGRDSAR